MTKRLLSASLLLAAVPVLAQGPGGPGPMGHGPMMSPGPFGMMKPVTNAPYSATFTNTSTEKLQDGTVLTHTITRVASRDSLGRTREEVTLPAGRDGKPHTEIVIFDPVAHTITRLNTEKKTAVVHQLPQPGGQHERGFGRRGPGSPDGAAPAEGAEGHGRWENKNVTTADLGSKTIGGVIATGKMVTRTIPANVVGNAAPIVTTHEEWVSPDLKIELTRSDVNPFRGTDSMTVSGLTKAEPSAALFQVPQGYTLEQAPERAGRGGWRRGGPAGPPPPPAGM